MAHIVILGAGTGGMSGAYEIREALKGNEHKITLINEREEFQFVPSNPWIAVGWRDERETTIPIKKYVNKKNIDFIAARVDEIKPEDNQLILNTGDSVEYDYLVIATGPELAFDQIPGAGPEGFTQSVCTVSHAKECHEDVKQLMSNPGPVIIGAFQGSSCFGPAYEYAFILKKHCVTKKSVTAFL